MKDKTHRRPHMDSEGVRHSCPPAGGIITARSREANHKLALTWPEDWWEILSTFLHFCFLVSIHFHQLWLSVMSQFHTLSGSAGERVRKEVEERSLTIPLPMICLYHEMSFWCFVSSMTGCVRLQGSGGMVCGLLNYSLLCASLSSSTILPNPHTSTCARTQTHKLNPNRYQTLFTEYHSKRTQFSLVSFCCQLHLRPVW